MSDEKKKLTPEEIKAEQDGLDVWRDIERWAVTGYDTIPAEKFDLMKWYGIYRQKPNEGLFMVRVRIPGGWFNAEQAWEIASIGREHALGALDITVRQNIQFHNIKMEELPEVVRRLHAVGISTTMTCGDTPRNFVACPLSGRSKDEIIDVTPMIQELNRAIVGNRLYSNLPRKFKIALSGCASHCAIPEINDIGLYGVVNKDGKVGFNLLAGGGLSTKAIFAKNINAFVPAYQAVEVCLAILEFFRDEGDRKNRAKSRMKFLVDQIGAEAFREKLVARLGYDLEPAVEAEIDPHTFRDHLGIQEQSQPGLYSIGFATTVGLLSPEDLFVAADLADQCGSGRLATTTAQNLIVLDVTEEALNEAEERALNAPTMVLNASPLRAGMVVCTGNKYCNLALVETKGRATSILNYLERKLPLDLPMKVSMTGCPRSCGQYHIADIGLRGTKTKVDGKRVDAFDIFAGCELGLDPKLSTQLEKAVPADKVCGKLKSILQEYLDQKEENESYLNYFKRQPAKEN